MNETPEPLQTAAQSNDALRARRAERQRQIRLLQLEEQIADANLRAEQARRRVDSAEQRLDELETERAELQAVTSP
jgi:chromosome segregation ATPase